MIVSVTALIIRQSCRKLQAESIPPHPQSSQPGRLLLPTLPGAAGSQRVAVASKQGVLYVADAQALGGYSQAGNDVLQQLCTWNVSLSESTCGINRTDQVDGHAWHVGGLRG